MSAYTPGPWKADVECSAVRGGDGLVIARTQWTKGTDVEQVCAANTRLIAAAPDLVELIHECRECLDDYSDTVDTDDGPRPNKAMQMLAIIEQALAKAGA